VELSQVVELSLEEQILLRQNLSEMQKEIGRQLEAANTAIKAEMEEQGLTEATAGDYQAVLSLRDRSTLDKTELISQGVTTEQIKRATKIATYLQLDVRKK
jgi:hypothetical protein